MNRTCSTALLVGMIAVGITLADEKPAVPKQDYRTALREFVQAISAQAKKADPAFLVVPQGGSAS